MFEETYNEIARSIYIYLDEHGKAPGVHLDTLLGPKTDETKSKTKQRSERYKRVLGTLKRIREEDSFNPDYTMQKLDDFVHNVRDHALASVFNPGTTPESGDRRAIGGTGSSR